MSEKKHIMDNILDGNEGGFDDRIDELDCLIYKNDLDKNDETPKDQKEKIWQVSKENVSVRVWESNARIKVTVSPGRKRNISMKQIANVAVNAILEELKKED